MKQSLALLAALVLGLASCAAPVSRNDTSGILAMGDSLMAWNRPSERAIANTVARELNEPVVDRSVIGARIVRDLPGGDVFGRRIGDQYVSGNWNWIVLNGGGNDLWIGCGCVLCDDKLDRLISKDGKSGEIPQLVSKLRGTGARLVYVGYLRSPGRGSVIEHCRDEGDRFEARVARMAAGRDGVYFLSLRDLVPHGDRSYHSADMIHPSVKASREIGQRVAELIKAENENR